MTLPLKPTIVRKGNSFEWVMKPAPACDLKYLAQRASKSTGERK